MGLQDLDKDESRQTRESHGIDTKQTRLAKPRSLWKEFLVSRNTLPGGCSEQILHILHLPSRSWGTTFCPLPSAPGPGETEVPGRRWHPRFPSLGQRTGRMLQGQNDFGDKITPSPSLALIPELCTKKGYRWRLGSWLAGFPEKFHCALWPEHWSSERAACGSFLGSAGFPHLHTTTHDTKLRHTPKHTRWPQNVGEKSKMYHLQSVTAPSSPAAPCRAET